MSSQMIVGEDILKFRAVMLYRALDLEVRTGMKMTAKANPFAIIKKEYGFKGNKKTVLEKLKKALTDAGAEL
jgi:hypothetical protein